MADVMRSRSSRTSLFLATARGPRLRTWQLLPVVLSACASLGATKAADRSHAAAMSPEGAVGEAKVEPLAVGNMFKHVEWRNIGPFRGGRSVAVSGVPGQPSVYYMGGTGGGVWKTDDAGAHWRNVSDEYFKTGSVGAIGVAASAPSVVYVGMGEHAVRGVMSSHGDGVYKSVDGGVTWRHVGLAKTRQISDVIVDPRDADIVYVAAQGAPYGETKERGVYKSVDGGATWRRVLYVDDGTGASSLTMDPGNPDVLYAAMWQHRRTPWKVESGPGSAIFKSSDGGKSWTKLAKDLPKEMGKVGLSASGARSGVVYANVEAADEKGGVYRSDDGGKSWSHVNKERVVQTRSWYYMEIFADPRDADTVYVLNAPMLKSVDGGKSFSRMKAPHGDHHDLWINPADPSNMINANDGGANITFNGGETWSRQDNQPTAQFYRVAVDQRFPYYVYGGQQDNSAVAVASRNDEGGLDKRDWYSVGGCETAYLAFDPKDPQHVMGGCYQGGISVYDHATGQRKDIEAYPADPFGELPREMKYRFNWNAPLFASPHDPRVVYHAAQVLLRSTDRGQSWAPMSPDLTRNETDKQGYGGGPITNEAAGGENYNTIMYATESRHAPGELWVGSDDGLVHLTRDNGQTWANVTPKAVKDGIVNAIEVSPHDAATAYITVMRYKLDDYRPYVYRTRDYGKSWKAIGRGVPDGSFVRVVREDPTVPDLLYAGTETGLYLSFDGGKKWHRHQSNLPAVPITDLVVHDNDLVAATAGRAFWVLDDLGPIQQSRGTVGKELALYVPKPSVRFGPGIKADDRPRNEGTNLAGGVTLSYFLPAALDEDEELVLEVLDRSKRVVRRYSSKKDESFKKYEGGPSAPPLLPVEAGVNRFVWDLRRETLPGMPDRFIMGSYQGSRVGPGEYEFRLSLGGQQRVVAGTVVADPRQQVTPEDFAAQHAMLEEVEGMHRQVIASLHRVHKAKAQLELHKGVLEANEGTKALAEQAAAVVTKLDAWETKIISTEQKTWQDVINYPNGLAAQFLYLKEQLDSHDPRPTKGSRDRLADLRGVWAREQAALAAILEGDLAAYNASFAERRLPVVVLPDE